jgi:hypothetical protein
VDPLPQPDQEPGFRRKRGDAASKGSVKNLLRFGNKMPLGSVIYIFGGLEVSAALSSRTPTTTKKRIPNLKGQTEPWVADDLWEADLVVLWDPGLQGLDFVMTIGSLITVSLTIIVSLTTIGSSFIIRTVSFSVLISFRLVSLGGILGTPLLWVLSFLL